MTKLLNDLLWVLGIIVGIIVGPFVAFYVVIREHYKVKRKRENVKWEYNGYYSIPCFHYMKDGWCTMDRPQIDCPCDFYRKEQWSSNK